MRYLPKPIVTVQPPADTTLVDLDSLRRVTDSAVTRAAEEKARADSLAAARRTLARKAAALQDSLAAVQDVRDSNMVLVDLVYTQRMIIADQQEEIVSLRSAYMEQMRVAGGLRSEIQVYADRERQHVHTLVLQQDTIDSLTRAVKTAKRSNECRIVGLVKCPSRGTMFLAGIATVGVASVTINAVK